MQLLHSLYIYYWQIRELWGLHLFDIYYRSYTGSLTSCVDRHYLLCNINCIDSIMECQCSIRYIISGLNIPHTNYLCIMLQLQSIWRLSSIDKKQHNYTFAIVIVNDKCLCFYHFIIFRWFLFQIFYYFLPQNETP